MLSFVCVRMDRECTNECTNLTYLRTVLHKNNISENHPLQMDDFLTGSHTQICDTPEVMRDDCAAKINKTNKIINIQSNFTLLTKLLFCTETVYYFVESKYLKQYSALIRHKR